MMPRLVQDTDMNDIDSWYRLRNETPIDRRLYPVVGYIVPNTAAGWLTQTDSGIALIENVITHPHADKVERQCSLESILHILNNYAKQRGYSFLLGFSKVNKIELYANTIGALPLGQRVLYGKEL